MRLYEGLSLSNFANLVDTNGPPMREVMVKELGDMLRGWCRMATYFDLSPEEIMRDVVQRMEAESANKTG